MKDRSIRTAIWLRKMNIGPNDIIALVSELQVEDYIPSLASIYVGAILHPWKTRLTLGKITNKVNLTLKIEHSY